MASKSLIIGLQEPLHIRVECITQRTNPLSLMYISDIHLRSKRAALLGRQIIQAAQSVPIDAFLLGGDLVDGPAELTQLRELLKKLCNLAPVYAIGGNHDRRIGLDRVRSAVLDGGAHWIHSGGVQISHDSRVVVITGPESPSIPDGSFHILCGHNPRIWKKARRQGYDLVLAGHLHGCQMVLYEYRNRLFPGAVFYPYCYLNHQVGSSRLVVSRGVSDLIPIRWRCPREVVLCQV